MPEFAKSYEFIPREYPKIDGVEVPWFVAEEGPLVEQADNGIHILWLPVLIDAPMPTPPEGRPDGERLVDGVAATD